MDNLIATIFVVGVLPWVILIVILLTIFFIGVGADGFIRAILGMFLEDKRANSVADFLRGLLMGVFFQTIFPFYILYIFLGIFSIVMDKIERIFEKTKSKPHDIDEEFEIDFEGLGIPIGAVIAAPLWFVLIFFDGYIAELMGK